VNCEGCTGLGGQVGKRGKGLEEGEGRRKRLSIEMGRDAGN